MKRILYRPAALADFAAIHDFIAEDDPNAARRAIAHIRRSIERLSLFPLSGRMSEVPGVYELVVPRYPYIVVFAIPDDVEIIAVFHCKAFDPEEPLTPRAR